MYIPEINEVKVYLEFLKHNGFIAAWELPYEQLLTRRSAAIFFLTPGKGKSEEDLWSGFEQFEHFSCRVNAEKKLSALEYRLTFSKEEKEKNELILQAGN